MQVRAFLAAAALVAVPTSALADGLTTADTSAKPSSAVVLPAPPPSNPSVQASPSPAPSADTLAALQLRLEQLQRQNAAQQSQLDALRAEIDRLRGGAPAVATAQQPPIAPGAPTVKKAPTDQSVVNIYQQQNALFSRRWTFTPSATQAFSDNRYFTLNGFLALGAIFLGNVNVTQQRSTSTVYGFDTTYGVNNRLQFDASVPYFSSTSTFTSVGANLSGQQPSEDAIGTQGIGDVQLGGYYQLRSESATSPAIVLNGHVSLPTGRAPYGIKLQNDPINNTMQFPSTLPTGSGVLGYQLGASFIKTSDPLIFFGGLSMFWNGVRHFNDISPNPTQIVPGVALPGNAFQYTIGTAFALNEKSSISFDFNDAITNELRLHPDGQPVQSVVGSGTNAASLGIATSYALDPHLSIITQLNIGLTKDAPNFDFGIRFPHRF